MCCDEIAVATTGQRLAYVETLQAIAQRSFQYSPAMLASTFRGDTEMKLLARIRHVLALESASPRVRPGSAALAAVGMAAIVSAILLCSSQPAALAQQEDQPRRTSERD